MTPLERWQHSFPVAESIEEAGHEKLQQSFPESFEEVEDLEDMKEHVASLKKEKRERAAGANSSDKANWLLPPSVVARSTSPFAAGEMLSVPGTQSNVSGLAST